MKSERRHELQHNELGQRLSALLAWAKRNANYLSWGVLLIAAIFAISVYVQKSNKSKLAARETEYLNAVNTQDPDARLERLKTVAAEEGGDRMVTAAATLAVADEYANRILTAKMTADDIKQLAGNAAKYYKAAADNFGEFPAVVIKAHIGLAKLAEDTGNFDEAAKEYTLALDLCPKGHPLRAEITRGQAALPTLRTPAPLATTRPATKPASEPATSPATAEAATRPAAKPASGPASAPATGATTKPAK